MAAKVRLCNGDLRAAIGESRLLSALMTFTTRRGSVSSSRTLSDTPIIPAAVGHPAPPSWPPILDDFPPLSIP